MGDGVDATRLNPTSAPAAATSSSTRAWMAGSRMMPFAHLRAPGLELRLDQRDDVGAGRSTGVTTGRIVPQRDERHVDGDEVDGAGQIGGRESGAR